MSDPWIESLVAVSADDLDQQAARQLVLEADVIFGTDTRSGGTSLLFGIELLEQIVSSGQAVRARIVRVLYDGASPQGERLVATIVSLKGSCHYGGEEYVPDAGLPEPKVRFLDPETGQTARIPASELTEGLVRADVLGVGKDVWTHASDFLASELQHPPFGPERRTRLQRIRDIFSEVYPLTLEEWEDGFRRDAFPEHEIEGWLWMAHCYEHFTEGKEVRPEQKRDIFSVILYTAANGADYVRRTIHPPTLSRRRVREIAAFVAARPGREKEGECGGQDVG
jgi:hypothetical protein